MSAYKISSEDKVLLLGEGNFSFSVELLNFNNIEVRGNTLIIATCLEKNTNLYSNTKKENIRILESKDVTVLHGVDATKLASYPAINAIKFSKIIFNFPHTGGKMKIHLNRLLLKEFFESVVHVLASDGVVVVALCNGQGGTEADTKMRHWYDTWQVVEMAAISELSLIHVEPFACQSFPNYKNIGYRSRDICFNTEFALVYVFRRATCNFSLDPEEFLTCFELESFQTEHFTTHLSKVYTSKLSVDPFKNESSAQSYLYRKLLHTARLSYKSVHSEDTTTIVVHETDCDDSFSCISVDNDIMKHIQRIVYSSDGSNKEVNIVKLLYCNRLCENFDVPPVSCKVLIFGSYVEMLVKEYASYLFDYFEIIMTELTTDTIICNNLESCNILEKYVVSESGHEIETYVIDIDRLAIFLFRLNGWQALWAPGTSVDETGEKPVFKHINMYSHEYSFDINFRDSEDYTEPKFFGVLWHIAADIIQAVEFLNTYTAEDSIQTYYCYRIHYKSHTIPLYRKRAVDIHQIVIGLVLEKMLGVKVN